MLGGMTNTIMNWFCHCTPIRLMSSRAAMTVYPNRVLLLVVLVLAALYYSYLWATKSKPTLYEMYASSEYPRVPLTTERNKFVLNGIDFTILSGELHYFRVHPRYWRDRLRKLRACGLNVVSTYIPWNLHNPSKGQFYFGNNGSNANDLLDIVSFVKIAEEEDLFVILKLGPYIGADLDFGGLPSWLLTYDMKVRSLNWWFMNAVEEYFGKLLPLLCNLQFFHGGPVIAFQLESNYDLLVDADEEYLDALNNIITSHGINSLIFTVDHAKTIGAEERLNGILRAISLRRQVHASVHELREVQAHLPVYVGELYINTLSQEELKKTLETLVLNLGLSVNLYVFHGGTNWGFINGAKEIQNFPFYSPDITSYDLSAPLSEQGTYTGKYAVVKSVLSQLTDSPSSPYNTALPPEPEENQTEEHGSYRVMEFLRLNELVYRTAPSHRVVSREVVPIELINITEGSGQSFGYTVYRKAGIFLLQPGASSAVLQVMGYIKDVAMVLVDGWRQTDLFLHFEQAWEFGYWLSKDGTMHVRSDSLKPQTLDILVENCGRISKGVSINDFDRKKGILTGPVLLDGVALQDWEIIALDFESSWINSLNDWNVDAKNLPVGPALYKCFVYLYETPKDTFLDMNGWVRGVVFVNGFNIGRYFHLHMLKTLYVPAPLLKIGMNKIIVFEMYEPGSEVTFSKDPISLEKARGHILKQHVKCICCLLWSLYVL